MIANGLPHNLDLLIIPAALPCYISILEHLSLRTHWITQKMKSITDEPTTSAYDKTFIANRHINYLQLQPFKSKSQCFYAFVRINLFPFRPTIRSTAIKLQHAIQTTTKASYTNVKMIANGLPHYLDSSHLLAIHTALLWQISTPEHLPLREYWIILKMGSNAEPTTSVYDKTFIVNRYININNTSTSLRILNPTTNYLTTQPQSSKFKYHPPDNS
jgi:hypothetical protein